MLALPFRRRNSISKDTSSSLADTRSLPRLHAFALRGGCGGAFDFHVKAHNNRVRSGGEEHIALANGANRSVKDFQIDFLALDLFQGGNESLA